MTDQPDPADVDECTNGGGPHLWTDTAAGVAICEFCGEETPW